MSGLSQQDRYEKGLNFFGAIARSLSHELYNVVAIITELTGLMEDLLLAAESSTPDPARLQNIAERIEKQLERGRSYLKQLNLLGHSVDEPRSAMEAGDILERVVEYSRRFATLKKMELKGRPAAGPVRLSGSPYDLQHVLYRCLDAALSASRQGSSLSLSLEAGQDGATFTIAGEGIDEPGEEARVRLDLAVQLAGHLGGRLDASLAPGQPLNLVLVLPGRLRLLSAAADEPI